MAIKHSEPRSRDMEAHKSRNAGRRIISGTDKNGTPRKRKQYADGRANGTNKRSKELLIYGEPFPANITSIYALYVYRKDLFLAYQSEQLKGRFDNVKYVVSFIGERGTTARFVGVYEIFSRQQNPHNDELEISI